MSKWQRWEGIMKAYPFETKRLNRWQPPYIVQPKYDGVRCRAVSVEGSYVLLSSEGNIIFSVPHINEALNESGFEYELDGELYSHGMSFEDIVSITSRTVNLHPNYQIMQYHIFDLVLENEPQHQRISRLYDSPNTIPNSIVLAPYYVAETLDQIMEVYNLIINDGYEGIIVRHIAAPYIRKRSVYVMKFKPKKEDTYEITGAFEELSIDKVPKDTLGGLVCCSGDGNTFNVGTGFTMADRKSLWTAFKDDPQSLVGKVCRVQYQHITSGKQVPRFPVFVEVIE